MKKLKQLTPEFIRYGIAAIAVIVATAIFFPGRQYFAKGQWALLYLLIIMFIASLSGIRAALLAAVLAFLSWNYFFLPPYHKFIVYDPKDWLSLIVFLIVGIIVGLQTGKLKEREAEARAKERESALLNRFSAHLVSELSIDDMARVLVKEVIASTKAKCVALFVPDKTGKLNEIPFTEATRCSADTNIFSLVEWTYRESKAVGIPEIRSQSAKPAGWPISVSHQTAGFDEERRDLVLPLQTAARQVGVLYIGEREDGQPFSFSETRLLVAVANQAAAFLERKQLQTLAIQADALREADRLKSTFLSSISHELKTPLASITAIVTNILESDVRRDESTIRSDLETIRGDLDRLNSSIGSLVDFSRLESDAWEPRKDWYELGEILGTTLSKISERQRPRISSSLPDDLPPVYVDFEQMSRVLQNLLENALTYSSSDAPVKVGAASSNGDVRIWVEDEGPGISPEEREHIFEKFYRGAASASAPSGTGLGLAIAAEIVKSHAGRMWAEDVVPHGARMVVSLPKESKRSERT